MTTSYCAIVIRNNICGSFRAFVTSGADKDRNYNVILVEISVRTIVLMVMTIAFDWNVFPPLPLVAVT